MRTRATFRPVRSSSRKLARRAATLSILSVAAALVVTSLTPVVVTSASWTGEEWNHGNVGTLSCTDAGNFKTRAAGRLLGGALLPTDLDAVASLEGVTATNDGVEAHPNPANAEQVGAAYVNPLGVSVLESINLPLTGGGLDELLSLPLATEVGAVNQYALADDNGVSQGASGVVNNSGFIQTTNDSDGNLPTLGTLKLSTLVAELTGEALSQVVAGITDLELEIGAVASTAELDACEAAWSGDLDSSLTRNYAIAGLDLGVTAPIVAGLSGTLDKLLDGLQTSLAALSDDEGLTTAITAGVSDLLSGVLGALNLGRVSVTGPAVTIDLTEVRELVSAPIGDAAVTLDLGTGYVQVDLASLIGEAYSGEGFNGTQTHGLNGLSPNTELVLNDPATVALTKALTDALNGWVAHVIDELRTAVYAAGVSTEVDIVVGGDILGLPTNVANINITVDGSLEDLLNNTATVTAVPSLLGGECKNPLFDLIPCAIETLVSPLLGGILSALTGGVAPLIGGILETTILGDDGVVPNNSLVGTLGTTLQTAITPVVPALKIILIDILGANGILSLRVNIQNDPAAGNDPDPPLTYPEWEQNSRAVPDDRYDVAALSVSVLDLAGTTSNVNLEFARSSVGVSCAVGGVWDRAERCAAY